MDLFSYRFIRIKNIALVALFLGFHFIIDFYNPVGFAILNSLLIIEFYYAIVAFQIKLPDFNINNFKKLFIGANLLFLANFLFIFLINVPPFLLALALVLVNFVVVYSFIDNNLLKLKVQERLEKQNKQEVVSTSL